MSNGINKLIYETKTLVVFIVISDHQITNDDFFVTKIRTLSIDIIYTTYSYSKIRSKLHNLESKLKLYSMS